MVSSPVIRVWGATSSDSKDPSNQKSEQQSVQQSEGAVDETGFSIR